MKKTFLLKIAVVIAVAFAVFKFVLFPNRTPKVENVVPDGPAVAGQPLSEDGETTRLRMELAACRKLCGRDKGEAGQNTRKKGKNRLVTTYSVTENPWRTGRMEDLIANQWAMDKTVCLRKTTDALGAYRPEYAPVPMSFCK